MVPRIPLLLAFSAATVFAATEAAKISYLVGNAQVKRAGKSIPARVSMACQVGDTLVLSKASRAELRYPDNTLLRLEENSKAVLTALAKGTPQPTLLGGKAWANVKKIGQGGTGFGVRTPTAVAAVRGTVFRVADGDSASNVRLYEGKVDVGSARQDSAMRARGEVSGPQEVSLENWVRLLRGEEVTFRRDGTWSRAKFDPKADLVDPWVRWNAQRDSAAGRPWATDSSASAAPSGEPDPFKE
jgi:hypothetical protein